MVWEVEISAVAEIFPTRFDNLDAYFVMIPISDIIGVEEQGEQKQNTKIIGARQIDQKRYEIKSITDTKDDRCGVLVIRNKVGIYEIHFSYSQLTEVKCLIDSVNKKETSILPKDNIIDNTDVLLKLKQLCDAGVISTEEFEAKKKEILERI